MRYLVCLITGLLLASTAGCAMYHARNLPAGPDSRGSAPAALATSSPHLPGLKPHPFDAAHGLDMTDVAILAVLNDPALASLRAREQVAAAQAFAAGLLPGPQVTYSRDRPTGNAAGTVTGRSLGLAYDVNSLVASHYRQTEAQATAKQTDLDVLWAEWQVAQQARMLFIRIMYGRQQLALTRQLRKAMQGRYQALQQALDHHDIAYNTLGLEFAAIQDVDTRVRTLQRNVQDAQFSLNELLGLQPEADLHMVEAPAELQVPDSKTVAAALQRLPQRRPDLIALKYAYQSADAGVRGAVMAQFPAINIGINRASDTSDIHTIGFSVGITFPFITGGPTYVHAAEAERNAVWQAYQQRLDEAVSGVHQSAADLKLIEKQLGQLDADSSQSRDALRRAHAAFVRGDLTVTDYYNLSINFINRELQAIELKMQQQQLQLALSTQLGLPPADLRHLARKETSK